MTEKVRVAVIGGGIVGCAMLYYLTRQGCTDALLIEKGELTSGSTWHAAGQVPFYSPDPFFSRIHKLSFDTFERVQEETGEPVGLHKCGSVRLGHTEEELLEYCRFAGFAPHLGIECSIIGPDEARALFPYLEGPDFAGALHVPGDGFTDPTQTTNALAKAARAAGAKILRHTRVDAIHRRPQGGWRIETSGDKSEMVEADIVVNCAGAWSPRISAMVGGHLPMTAIEHQYFVTESVPGLAERAEELPILRNMSVPYYIRQERDGFLVAAYEEETLYWGDFAPPWDFDQALLPPDLDRAMPFIEATMAEIPVLGTVGVKTVVNGPTPRSADLTPLAGPAHGYPDFFVMTGVVGGFLQCGTAKYVAEWILDGAPSIDMSPVDIRRFGDYATRAYTEAKLDVSHAYSGSVYHPHSESSAGRGARTSAVHGRLAAKRAVFGARNGWEVPNWFAPDGMKAKDAPSYRRANWFPPVGEECRAVRRGVGVIDMSSLAKFALAGPEAEAVLAGMSANRLPQRPGGMTIAPMLNARGGVAAWLAATHLGKGGFLLTGSAASEQRDFGLLRRATAGKDADAEDVTEAWGHAGDRGPQSSRSAGRGRGHRHGPAGLPALYGAGGRDRLFPCPGPALFGHRGGRLRDLRPAERPARPLRPPARSGRGYGAGRFRLSGPGVPAPGGGSAAPRHRDRRRQRPRRCRVRALPEGTQGRRAAPPRLAADGGRGRARNIRPLGRRRGAGRRRDDRRDQFRRLRPYHRQAHRLGLATVGACGAGHGPGDRTAGRADRGHGCRAAVSSGVGAQKHQARQSRMAETL